MKSTSGVFLVLLGPHTFFPLNGISRKQTAQSHSTPEAEIVAADEGLRSEGYPAVELWKVILDRVPVLKLYEDNESTQLILKSGKFPRMRHVKRVHAVSISSLHNDLKRELYVLADA